jgi:hypothetical protein
MYDKMVPLRFIIDGIRPYLETDSDTLRMLKENAQFFQEKADSSDDLITASILRIAAEKLSRDLEVEIALRN